MIGFFASLVAIALVVLLYEWASVRIIEYARARVRDGDREPGFLEMKSILRTKSVMDMAIAFTIVAVVLAAVLHKLGVLR
jgi:hypothetical protein